MTDLSPKDFASLLRKTNEIREASWIETDYEKYTTSWDQAAEVACWELGIDPRWAKIASVTCLPGYCDVWDWCDEVS
jgi:hypothetical protein